MPEYWNTEAERSVRRPILTEEQREQIAMLWVDELQLELLEWLANSAKFDEFHPEPTVAACSSLRVTNLDEAVEEADLRVMFECFGSVTDIYRARNFAFIAFEERPKAVQACQHFDGFCYQNLVMRVEFAKSSGVSRPELGLEYPDDG